MAIIQIASDAANNGDDTASAVFGSEPASGSVIALFAFMRNGGSFTFPASYTQDFSHNTGARNFEFQSKVYAGEGNSFTVTRDNTTSDMYLIGYELTAGSVFDQSDTAEAGGGGAESLTVGPITTTHDDSAIMTGIIWNNNVSGQAVNESFVLDGEGDPRGDSASKEVMATGNFDVDWTWTTVTEAVGVMVSYGVPAEGGTTRGSRLILMGCS